MIVPVDIEKRVYYQYLGFLDTSALFINNYCHIEQFNMPKYETPTFEEFDLSITKQLPLGKRVELFFEYYIRQGKEYNIIKKNIQIIQNKTTLGELDYIIENVKTKKQFHIELVYKYYLYKENIENEIQRYVGPNNDDSLEDRIEKLQNKQLPLLFKDETKEYLKDINIKNIQQKVCFKANIFLPYQAKEPSFTHINQRCLKGTYLTADEFFNNKTFRTFEYFFPQKQDWLINPKYCKHWICYDKIKEQINDILKSKKTPLVWFKNENKYGLFFLVNCDS